jgi:hypothetical protein
VRLKSVSAHIASSRKGNIRLVVFPPGDFCLA